MDGIGVNAFYSLQKMVSYLAENARINRLSLKLKLYRCKQLPWSYLEYTLVKIKIGEPGGDIAVFIQQVG
jgi:hypothetical protein